MKFWTLRKKFLLVCVAILSLYVASKSVLYAGQSDEVEDFLSDVDDWSATTPTDQDINVDDLLEPDVVAAQENEQAQTDLGDFDTLFEFELSKEGIRFGDTFLSSIPMPAEAKKYFNNLSIKNITFNWGGGTKDFPGSSVLSGKLYEGSRAIRMSDGSQVVLQAISVSKTDQHQGGYVIRIPLPDTWKISDTVAGFYGFDLIKFNNPQIVLSTFDYAASGVGYAIEKGLNCVFDIAPDFLSSTFGKFVSSVTQRMTAHCVLKPHVTNSVIKGTLALKDAVLPTNLLLQVAGFNKDKVPEKLTRILDGFNLKNQKMEIELGADLSRGQKLTVSGTSTLLSKPVAASLVVHRAVHDEKLKEKTNQNVQTRALFTIGIESGVRLTELISLARTGFDVRLQEPQIIIANYADGQESIKAGVNIKGQVTLKEASGNEMLSTVGTIMSSMSLNTVDLYASFAEGAQDAQVSIKTSPIEGQQISLAHLFDTATIPLPSAVKQELLTMKLQTPALSIDLTRAQQTAVLAGGITFNDRAFPAKISLQKTESGLGASLILSMTPGQKLSDIFSTFSFFDGVIIEKAAIIFSTYNYTDEELKEKINAGMTIVGRWFLTGNLEPLQKLYDTGGGARLESEATPFGFKVYIPENPQNALFNMKLPASCRLDVNFESIGEKIPPMSNVSKVIKQLSIYDFMVEVVPLNREIVGGVTVSLVMPQQKITVPGKIGIRAEGTVIEIAQTEKLQPQFMDWFKFDESAAKVVITPLGVPSNVELRGGVTVGNTQVKGEIKAGTDGFALIMDAHELTLQSVVDILNKVGSNVVVQGKKLSIDPKKFPELGLKNAYAYIVPTSTSIAGEQRASGFSLKAQMNVLGTTGEISLEKDVEGFKGSGFISRVDKPYLVLESAAHGGPTLRAQLTPFTQDLLLDAIVKIPLLGVSGAANIYMQPTKFVFHIDSTVKQLFTMALDVNIDLFQPDQMRAHGIFKRDLQSALDALLRGQVLVALNRTTSITNALSSVADQFNTNINYATNYAKGTVDKVIQKAIAGIEPRIAVIERKIAQKKKECADAGIVWKAFTCSKAGIEITALGIELAGLKTSQAAVGVTQQVGKIQGQMTKKISELTGAVNSVVSAQSVGQRVAALLQIAASPTTALNVETIEFDVEPFNFIHNKSPMVTVAGSFMTIPFSYKVELSTIVQGPEDFLDMMTYKLMQDIIGPQLDAITINGKNMGSEARKYLPNVKGIFSGNPVDDFKNLFEAIKM